MTPSLGKKLASKRHLLTLIFCLAFLTKGSWKNREKPESFTAVRKRKVLLTVVE
jgi:hypothetical protein